MPDLELEPHGQAEFACDCCGETTHRVWGSGHEGDATRCVYSVQRAAKDGPHPGHMTLGYGAWGEGTTSRDRVSIYAEFGPEGVEFVDHPAPGVSVDQHALLGAPMRARNVRGDPRSAEVVETADFVLRSDDRLRPAGVA